jgi:membrane protein CcdC involved in cytochrome C biogenesis
LIGDEVYRQPCHSGFRSTFRIQWRLRMSIWVIRLTERPSHHHGIPALMISLVFANQVFKTEKFSVKSKSILIKTPKNAKIRYSLGIPKAPF